MRIREEIMDISEQASIEYMRDNQSQRVHAHVIAEAVLEWLDRKITAMAVINASSAQINSYNAALSDVQSLWKKPKISKEIKQFVDNLFTNVSGQEASFLVLTTAEGKNLGGRCKEVIIGQLEKFLRDQQFVQ